MTLTWKEAITNKKYRQSALVWLIGLAFFVVPLPYYFNYIIQPKQGVQLTDYVHNLLPAADWSLEIFILIFAAPALFFLSNFKSPLTVLFSLQCYVAVNLMRMVSVYLFTLEAPSGIIPLVDPFLAKVVYGNSTFVKDLFFSGHTCTLFMLFLIERKQWVKWVLGLATGLIALLLIWQRVHYTIDIIGAVLACLLVYGFFSRNMAKIDWSRN
ncbi:MAG: phosphatase PAP2-related protein [Flammeovirgaceae bacterium]